jgi:hypothetical protein
MNIIFFVSNIILFSHLRKYKFDFIQVHFQDINAIKVKFNCKWWIWTFFEQRGFDRKFCVPSKWNASSFPSAATIRSNSKFHCQKSSNQTTDPKTLCDACDKDKKWNFYIFISVQCIIFYIHDINYVQGFFSLHSGFFSSTFSTEKFFFPLQRPWTISDIQSQFFCFWSWLAFQWLVVFFAASIWIQHYSCSGEQGCQIFLYLIYPNGGNIPNFHYITKWPQNIQNGPNIPKNFGIYQLFSFKGPQKFTPI